MTDVVIAGIGKRNRMRNALIFIIILAAVVIIAGLSDANEAYAAGETAGGERFSPLFAASLRNTLRELDEKELGNYTGSGNAAYAERADSGAPGTGAAVSQASVVSQASAAAKNVINKVEEEPLYGIPGVPSIPSVTSGYSCGATCGSTCGATCGATCGTTCGSTCTSTCNVTCGATCGSTCGTTCTATCTATCGVTCGSTCGSTCAGTSSCAGSSTCFGANSCAGYSTCAGMSSCAGASTCAGFSTCAGYSTCSFTSTCSGTLGAAGCLATGPTNPGGATQGGGSGGAIHEDTPTDPADKPPDGVDGITGDQTAGEYDTDVSGADPPEGINPPDGDNPPNGNPPGDDNGQPPPEPGDRPPDIPDDWAAEEVARCILEGFLSERLQSGYRQNITRLDFCEALAGVIVIGTEFCMLDYEEIETPFTDVDSGFVTFLTELGIVRGVGEGRFNPDGEITRQEAAVMLCRAGLKSGVTGGGTEPEFEDLALVADWALEALGYVVEKGIMKGDGVNFDPLGFYTRQQAYLTIIRLYDILPGIATE